MISALELRGVTKNFGGKQAVAGLDLNIVRGEFYALLGANGAGKTTSLRMIAGLLQPDSGSIRVLGHDLVKEPIAAKQRLAFLPDEPMLYGKLRCTEYLEFVAGLWGVDGRIAEKKGEDLLRWLDLWDARGNYCENLSRGMQQKLTLAGALIHDPALLILDEPLTGLDAAAARRVKDFLATLVRDGLTVLFTTHILEVAERMASRIGLIRSGQLIAEGTLTQLRARYGADDSTLEDLFLSATGPDGAGAA
ncbi:ABC transporter ATP-binding protein [Nevskia sp.]|uniref:ABC transporter ATP-binding protein n=1 Tax=Nevskia sp. TaxID=1929292 RepID=UPI0025CF25B9|nr:ABC transporter ATP-binding protein [Nevskia sp.]